MKSMQSELPALKNSLLKWYRENRRPLPWRANQNPYSVWISEIMLQQTTVTVVTPYFERFMKSFPTVEALASAHEDKVLSHWSGLGYYSRARNLHKAAKAIAELKGFPQTSADLLNLPGIGPYTAAAVASIAFNEEIAAVDGNVIRVVSRLFNISKDCASREGLAEITTRAQELIAGQPPSEHNQAMMELGATLCIPQNPPCLLCPVQKHCQSLKNGTMNERPVKTKKRNQEPWLWKMFLMNRGEKIALTKNENGTPWLRGTWVLPGEAKPWTAKRPPPSDFKHSITHHKIFVQLKKVKDAPEIKKICQNQNVQWIALKEIENYGVSSIVHKALLKAGLSILSLFLFFGCHTAEKTPNAFPLVNAEGRTAAAPKDFQAPQTFILTHDGENANARFSSDGQKIIFQSKKRPKHENSQIYILNLQNQKEKRITFNDGDDSDPDFGPNDKKIIYASTTDEIKEHPAPLASPPPAPAEGPSFLERLPNSEIYQSDVDGSHIERLTEVPGYDGGCRYSPDKHRILFSSGREGDFELFEMNANGSDQHRVTNLKGFDGQGIFSPDGKQILWTSSRDDDKIMQLNVMTIADGKIKTLTTKNAIHWYPTWSTDGKKILFSSNRDDENNYEIYALNADGSCLKRLTYSKGSDLAPLMSPDGKKILFNSNRSGTQQLYLMDYLEPKDCSTETP